MAIENAIQKVIKKNPKNLYYGGANLAKIVSLTFGKDNNGDSAIVCTGWIEI